MIVDLIARRRCDAASDLLSAGLGLAGLRAPPPVCANPLVPMPAELRRLTIHTSYNAILATGAAAGCGRLYATALQGSAITGWEYVAVCRDADGRVAHTVVVQVPDQFDRRRPCIVAAPASGSRGVYGAIGAVGAWALAKGCAVAYTDKGCGTGFFVDGHGYDPLGLRVDAGHRDILFVPAAPPPLHHIATKHAHSGRNPEQDWGRWVLEAIELALHLLNQHHARPRLRYDAANTRVIAAGVSNGGGAALRAAELDRRGLIDAVVVAAPNIQPTAVALPPARDSHGLLPAPLSLLAQATQLALLVPCAALDPELAATPLRNVIGTGREAALNRRCALLRQLGELEGENTAAQARCARGRVEALGLRPDTAELAAAAAATQLWESAAVTYANAYGRCEVEHPAAGIGFAFLDRGRPAPLPPALAAQLGAIGSGIPPLAGIELVYSDATDDPATAALLKLRELAATPALREGAAAVAASGDLGGRPAIIVHGRQDGLIAVNHSARGYVALNTLREGSASRLRYYEIDRCQHFDALLQLPAFAARFVPLQVYYEQALERMWAHLQDGAPLPPSQWVPAQPGGVLPKLSARPGARGIKWVGDTLVVP